MDDNMIWVTNINEDPEKNTVIQSMLREKHTVGLPKATPADFGRVNTVEELKAQSIIGLYREDQIPGHYIGGRSEQGRDN